MNTKNIKRRSMKKYSWRHSAKYLDQIRYLKQLGISRNYLSIYHSGLPSRKASQSIVCCVSVRRWWYSLWGQLRERFVIHRSKPCFGGKKLHYVWRGEKPDVTFSQKGSILPDVHHMELLVPARKDQEQAPMKHLRPTTKNEADFVMSIRLWSCKALFCTGDVKALLLFHVLEIAVNSINVLRAT